MNNWFECKVRYEKMMENGIQKKVTEPYLVDALSFTEAEARIIKEITPFISGEFTVSDIKRAKYTELFEDPTGDIWYKCKVYFITLDEKSGAEKKTACNMLVQAPDIDTALKNLNEGMKGTMADYQVAAINETAIMDVYPYAAESNSTQQSPFQAQAQPGDSRLQEILQETETVVEETIEEIPEEEVYNEEPEEEEIIEEVLEDEDYPAETQDVLEDE